MTIPETMTAVCLTGIGGPEKLVYRSDMPVPKPGSGQVLIHVGAAGVNNTDINTRIGWYSKSVKGATSDEGKTGTPGEDPDDDGTWRREGMKFPRIQGADVCGKIVAVGTGVDESRIGERILIDPCPRPEKLEDLAYFGSECDGGFAQFTMTEAKNAHTITNDMTDAELATFPCSYSTAENLLTRSRCSASDVVLVTGSSGGVGSAAVQLAKVRGAKVIAVCGASKAEKIKSLGVDQVVDRDADLAQVLGSESVSLVIDLVGGPKWPTLLDVLVRGGRYATAGAIAGPLVELDLRTLYLKDLTLVGCTGLDEGVFQHLVRLINDRKVQPLLCASYPLVEISKAQEDFLKKTHVGKLVLLPPAIES